MHLAPSCLSGCLKLITARAAVIGAHDIANAPKMTRTSEMATGRPERSIERQCR